jgi:hypothetical protein
MMEEDTWFAWYPVRIGALGTGRLVWLRRLRRLGRGLHRTYWPL